MSGFLRAWRDTSTSAAILDFVAAVSTEGSPDFVSPEDRIAVFDNDGTLWTEMPIPTQLHFLLLRWKAAAEADPSLAQSEPYRSAISGDLSWFAAAVEKHYAGDDSDIPALFGAIVQSSAGASVEEYEASVSAFYRDARHLTLQVPYSRVVYQPMVELIRLLDAHDFRTYIVSGGERDFIRQVSENNYGIPVQRVIGTEFGLEYDADENVVRLTPDLSFLDDGPNKPVRIWMRTGRRPILAGGNSNGDIPMLRFAQGSPRSLVLLVHHDDDTRRGDQPYDKGAEKALAEAPEHGFTVVSVREDWAQVFPAGD